jgi:photosystem II stability/assembly factor-like uncharacterized protein
MQKTLLLSLCFLLMSLSVFAQDPSVVDTIEVKWDTLKNPTKGPLGTRYYQYGDSLFHISNDFYRPPFIYGSGNFGKTWTINYNRTWTLNNELTVFRIIPDTCRLLYLSNDIKNTPVYGNFYFLNRYFNGGSNSNNDGNFETLMYFNVMYKSNSGCAMPVVQLSQGINDSTLILYQSTSIDGSPAKGISTDLGKSWQPYKGMEYYSTIQNNVVYQVSNKTIKYTSDKEMIFRGDSIDVSQIGFSDYYHYTFVLKNNIFSAIYDGTIQYTTTNKGQTWQIDTLPFKISQLIQKGDSILISTNKGLFFNRDIYLKNLKKLYPKEETTPTFHSAFSMLKSGWYLNNYKGELLRSTNRGETWDLVNNTEGVLTMTDVTPIGDSVILKGANGIIFKSKDFKTVEPFSINPIPYRSITFGQSNALFSVSPAAIINRSKDNGLTWQTIYERAYGSGIVKNDDSLRIYGVYSNAFFLSKNNGDSFSERFFSYDFSGTQINDVILANNNIYYVLVYQRDTDRVLKKGFHVFKSIDEGRNWTKTAFFQIGQADFNNQPTAKLFFLKNKIIVSTNSRIVYESKNGGDTWTNTVSDFSYDNITEYGKYLIYLEKNRRHFKITADDGLSFTYVKDIPYYDAYKFGKNYIYAHITPIFEGLTHDYFTYRISMDALTNRVKAEKDFAVLRGSIFKDENNNCKKDTSEKGVLAHKMVRIMPRNFATMTDSFGYYEISLPPDSYTVSTANLPYYKTGCSDSAPLNFVLKANETKDTNFVFKKTNEAFDLAMRLSTGSRARPGFEVDFVLKIDNNGTEKVDSALVTLSLPTYMSFKSAEQSGVLKNNQVQWMLYNQSVSEAKTLTARLRVSPDAPLSSKLFFEAKVNVLNKKDTIPQDNLDTLSLTVTGAFDPNDKTVLPEGEIPIFTKELDYLIRFQNTGNDTAFKVIVVDTLSQNLDIFSLKNIVASHPFTVSNKKNILTFIFSNIFLPDSFVNERASHGFIRFKVSPKKGIKHGENIANTAAIYFDFNKPIFTNTAKSNVIKPVVTIQQTVPLCENQPFKGKIYTKDTTLFLPFFGILYDTVSVTNLSIKPKFEVLKDTTLRGSEKFLGKDWKDGDIAFVNLKTVWGCDSILKYSIHKLTATGEESLNKIGIFKVYPNPVKDYVSMSYELNKATWVEIVLFNSAGQKVKILKEKTLNTEGVYSLQSDLNLIHAGVYQVGFLTNEGIIYRRFVKIE